MNKKYIDFVPKSTSGVMERAAKSSRRSDGGRQDTQTRQQDARVGQQDVQTRRQGTRAERRNAKTERQSASEAQYDARKKMRISEQEEVRIEEIFAEKPAETTRRFGVIEDFSEKFVSKEVEKRPLSTSVDNIPSDYTDAAVAKSKRIPRIPLIGKKKELKVTEASTIHEAKGKTQKMPIPERPFVNMDKVEKRPLSRNVYRPRVGMEPKEESQGTITIIEKPEKDSRIGLVVTIIITIILGAAAGTVAFLLLPK